MHEYGPGGAIRKATDQVREHVSPMKVRRLIPLMVVLLLSCLVSPGNALPSRVHAILAYEAARMPAVPAEIGSDVYVGVPDNPISEDQDNSLCEGAFDEDYDRTPRSIFDVLDFSDPNRVWGWGSHFWNPMAGPNAGLLPVLNAPPSQNAYQRGAMLYHQAVNLYPTDPAGAYYVLGRAVHLLTDMATPAHTHLDVHVADQLAGIADAPELAADSFEHYLSSNYVTRLDMPSDPDPTGRLRFEQDFIAGPIDPVVPAYLSDGGHPDLGDVYKVFYSMARESILWDSNDRDGAGPAGIGGGSLRWFRQIDVTFADATTLEVWEIAPDGTEVRLEPIATIDQGRILLPHDVAPSSKVRISHDGVDTIVPGSRITRLGQIADADCKRMAQDLMPKAIAHTETLYRLFWRDTHPLDTTLDAAPLTGDVDGDGFVTILDLLMALPSFGQHAGEPAFDHRADLNGDGRVDMADLLIIVSNFGRAR
jgi:hypothetical protein